MSRGERRDLQHSDEIKELVRDAYGNARDPAGAVACKLYSSGDLARLPHAAAAGALGVADLLRHTEIEPGETILDLGCGNGPDTILAARRTGPAGRVIALDFLGAMLERTATAAAEAGLHNVETVEAEMEAIPLQDGSVDHVISNAVLSLSPRKARTLAECARVLRPGGKLSVADFTVDEEELPPEVITHPAAWAG